MGCCTVGHWVGVSPMLPLMQIAVVQLSTFQDSPFFLCGYTSLQSRVVVDGIVDVEIVVLVVLGIDVVGHGLDCMSTLQDALQYAT